MPELPEVETVVRTLRPRLIGRRMISVVYAAECMARSDVGLYREVLPGKTMERLTRRGKWMFLELTQGFTLVVHLGMTGRLLVLAADADLAPHTHLRLLLQDEREELRYVDPRRFGELWLSDTQGVAAAFGPDRLGPEPTEIRVSELAQSLAKTRRNLKAILLDQRVIAGIGNIYADEVLFAARLNPQRGGESLTDDEVARLHQSIRAVIRRAIRQKGTTIRDYVAGDGAPGAFQNFLCVYGRQGQPCKICAQQVELFPSALAGRTTHWCPRCQA